MSATKSIVIIEFYDLGVRICNGEAILADSISCALIESNKAILVGKSAEQQAHLRPREISTNFWSRLAENSDTKQVISNAEIAYNHLKHVWELANCSEKDVILITPANLNKPNLGLLLGICKKLSINVTGIVCNASLAMQQRTEKCKAVFLDLLQQNIVVTEIIQSDKGVSLQQPSHNINFGLQNFTHNCAKFIADQFIAKTRFDPLHSAKNEQQFFDKLPLWLKLLCENSTIECQLSSDNNSYSVEINDQQLQTVNVKLFDEIANHLNLLFHKHNLIAIYCSASCKKAFGLHKFLATLPGCAIIQLDKTSLARYALSYENEISNGEEVHYVNTLSLRSSSKLKSLQFNTGKLANLASLPTHILVNSYAYSLEKDLFINRSNSTTEPRIMLEKNPNSLCKISINNLNAVLQVFNKQIIKLDSTHIDEFSAVKIGDVLTIEGCQTDYVFIKVAKT